MLSHMVVLFLAFWELSILFSTVATPIYIPTNSVGGFPFLHILANNFYSCFFWMIAFWQVWGDISWWFLCAFLFLWASFHIPVGHLYILFGKMSIQFFCPFFNHIFFFDVGWAVWAVNICWVVWTVNICQILTCVSNTICKCFLTFSSLSSHFVNDFLYCAENFKFN